MNIAVLKDQIGRNILNSLDSFRVEENNKSMGGKDLVILENEGRKAKITLNCMDLYNITLIDRNNNFAVKEDVYNDQLRDILKKHFSFSLFQAKQNNDIERQKEIERKAKEGKRVRII